MSTAKLVEPFKPPRLDYSLVYKTDRKLRSDWMHYDLVKQNTIKWSDVVPRCHGLPPIMIGTCVFKYIVLKDSEGVHPLPLFQAGPVFGYIAPKNQKVNLVSNTLCHISHGFAWLYDDYGNIKKFKANVIKFYYEEHFGFTIERYDSIEETKEENIDGRETTENN